MRIRPASVAAAFALSTVAVTGLAAPAVAQTPVCEEYSGNCPTVIPTVNDRTPTPPPVQDRREDCPEGTTRDSGSSGSGQGDEDCITTTASTLPFTGGELVLLTALGAGALAGGTALVLAGRRRTPDVA